LSGGGSHGGRSCRVDVPRQTEWRVAGRATTGAEPEAGGLSAAASAAPVVSTWSIMLAVWPLDERPDEMRKPEVVNSLTFDQMVTYKKLYDARMKKEGKGEEVFGRDAPIPETRFEAGLDDCAEKLHPARYD
jgi:hypothetical protein